MHRHVLAVLLAACIVLAVGPRSGRAETVPKKLLIVGATVHPGDGPARRADVLVVNGKIAAVGLEIEAKDAPTIDAKGLVLTPGFVDARGLLGVGGRARGPGRPGYRVADTVDPWERGGADLLAHGVTAVAVEPAGTSTWGGRTAVMKTGEPLRILPVDAGIFATIGVTRRRSAPNPLSIGGEFNTLIGSIARARNYRKSLDGYRRTAAAYRQATVKWAIAVKKAEAARKDPPAEPKKPKRPRHDPDSLALSSLVKGRAPLRLEVHGARNILAALAAARKAEVHLVLEGCTGIGAIAEKIPESVTVVLATRAWGGPPEAKPDPADAVALAKAGVPFAIASFGPTSRRARFLPDLAALAIRAGLDRDRALRAITADAARACGLADRAGRIAKGLDADLVCLDGDPFVSTSRIRWVMAEGRVVRGCVR